MNEIASWCNPNCNLSDCCSFIYEEDRMVFEKNYFERETKRVKIGSILTPLFFLTPPVKWCSTTYQVPCKSRKIR